MALGALRSNISSDLLAEDIRQTLHHLGEITGEVTSDDILQSIFSKFCIGK
jgi:tRNA modification GTPase